MTAASTKRRTSAPTKPSGPTTDQIGFAAMAWSANGWETPVAPSLQATPMTTTASGNS